MNITGGFIKYLKNNSELSAEFPVSGQIKSGPLKISSSFKKTKYGSRLTVTAEAVGNLHIKELFLKADPGIKFGSKIFCNGYQSWTDSREFEVNEKIKPLNRLMKLIKLNWFGDYNFHASTGKGGDLHSYTYSYVRASEGDINFVGSLDESSAYTIFEYQAAKNILHITKECGGMIVSGRVILFDLLISSGSEYSATDAYFSALNPKGKHAPFCTGWTSWYNYYTNISQDIILENLNAFSERGIPIDTFQIDDGWQRSVGDWLHIKPSFPKGMKFISSEIKKRGYKSGLWLAPFICEKNSSIFKIHYDWVLKDQNGNPVPCGWNPGWSGDFYALDIYNPSFGKYLEQVFDTIFNKWGFDMVKLDFLYGAAQLPRNGKTRGAVMRDAMKLLRKLCGRKIILGCGAPLGSAFGLVDYCRIGSDVALRWEDWRLDFVHYRERVSTVNSLTSTIGRRHMNGMVFVNDPDVFILRDENCLMSPEQKYTLFILNNIFGGLLFCSDNLNTYSEETMSLYKSMFPFKKKIIKSVAFESGVYKISFSIEGYDYIAYSNFSSGSRGDVLDKGRFFIKTQSREPEFINGPARIILKPYETRCYLKIPSGKKGFAGSTGHLFSGSEISDIAISGRRIKIKFDKKICGSERIFIQVPSEGDYFINGIKISATMTEEGFILASAELRK